MTTKELVSGSWRIGVALADKRCSFAPNDWLRKVELGYGRHSGRAAAATVEVRRIASGIVPWALVSGHLKPNSEPWLNIEVAHTGPISVGNTKDCTGLLGQSLTTGLPLEFANSVLVGLAGGKTKSSYAGNLQVVGAGYDEVDSSPIAFESAGRVLRLLLDSLISNTEEEVWELLTNALAER